MREEIAEQLGVTPTPGGLEVLLRQSENNRMAHGGIVHMNQGGEPLMNPLEFGSLAEFNRQMSSNFGGQSPTMSGSTAQESADARAIANAISNRDLISNRIKDLESGNTGIAGLGKDGLGDALKTIASSSIASGMSGGLFPFLKWGAGQLAKRFGGKGTRTRLIQQMENAGASQEDIDAVKNMSTHEFQKQMVGVEVPGERYNEETGETETFKTLPFQDMSARMSTAQALMAMPVYSAMYNVGGAGGVGKGAGGNFGQGQRMIQKEQRKIKQRAKQYDQFGDENWYLSEGYAPEQANYYANTFKNMHGSGQDLIDTMQSRGFGQGAYDAFERVAESPPESAADSRGRPQNWSEIFAHYQETGSFEDSPEAQWGGG